MSCCKETEGGQNSNATDMDITDIQLDGEKKKVYMAHIPTSTWEAKCPK